MHASVSLVGNCLIKAERTEELPWCPSSRPIMGPPLACRAVCPAPFIGAALARRKALAKFEMSLSTPFRLLEPRHVTDKRHEDGLRGAVPDLCPCGVVRRVLRAPHDEDLSLKPPRRVV